MSDERLKTCSKCAFYHEDDWAVYDCVGECRFNPPMVVPTPAHDDYHYLTAFPQVESDMWCGKFKEKANEDDRSNDHPADG